MIIELAARRLAASLAEPVEYSALEQVDAHEAAEEDPAEASSEYVAPAPGLTEGEPAPEPIEDRVEPSAGISESETAPENSASKDP